MRWAERAGVKRLVTDQDAEIVDRRQEHLLPYQVCLSELLFGAPLYKQRQVMMGLPDPATRTAASTSALDAG